MAINSNMTSAVQEYVFVQSEGTVIVPVNGSWIQAYCEYLGITESVNGSWLQALCEFRSVTSASNGSWVQALAESYNITLPINGSWWMALANAPAPLPAFIWNINDTLWESETRTWSLT